LKKNKVFFLHLNVDKKISAAGPMAREPSHRAGWRPMAVNAVIERAGGAWLRTCPKMAPAHSGNGIYLLIKKVDKY
jgi:hypothetical protein